MRLSVLSTLGLLLIFFLPGTTSVSAQCYDVKVAADGSGDYTSIQSAIDAAPNDLTSPFVIYIAKGVYDEKLFIQKNFITLVGESRDSTIITTAELRRVWRETHKDDWGAATINVDNKATDLTLAHLTVRNNFADVHPDFPDNHDHTFAIRGGGDRVIIIDCNVTTTGGDTLSLWNTGGGRFYHNQCYFEGYVDYVAPRGYCYITDCTFFGHNTTASIWHDGTGAEDHKLVIRHSRFDGVQGFALGRYHKDAAFYLLDCDFTSAMKNQEIYHTGSEALAWGERVYYQNCHGLFVDWSWFKDNLVNAAGQPDPESITPSWTYNGSWDPEAQIDGLLPSAFLPIPANQSACIEPDISLSWVPGYCATSHLVYFGTSADPEFITATTEHSFSPGALLPGTTYFWRVDEVTANDTVRGPAWSFTTSRADGLGLKATSPVPADGADYETNVVRLDWSYQTCNTDSFYVYFGSSPANLFFEGVVKYPAFFKSISQLKSDSVYYWRIDSKNESGISTGDIWSFRLNPSTTSVTLQAKSYTLSTPRPNPFTTGTSVQLHLQKKSYVGYRIFDTAGKLLESQSPRSFSAGDHVLRVMESVAARGLYFMEVEIDQARDTLQLLHLD